MLGKMSVTPKKKLAQKRAAPKKTEVKTKVGGKTAGALNKHVQEKKPKRGYGGIHTGRDWERGRVSNREICRDCPTSKVQIRRVWTSC